jgi:hypothetical protein
MLESAVHGVILQHVSEIVDVEEVVDTDNLNVLGEVFHSSAEDHTADAAETIDTEFESHYWILLFYCEIASPCFLRQDGALTGVKIQKFPRLV